MNELVAVILFDSLRNDFVTNTNTPFLFSLAKNGYSGTLNPQLSFSLHPAWFAGIYPNKSGKCGYYFSPKTSPYRQIKPLRVLVHSNTKLIKISNSLLAKIIHPCGTWASYLPLRYGKYFDFTDKKPPWDTEYLSQITLFDLLRKNNLKWLFIGSPGTRVETCNVFRKFKKEISAGISFLWLHFGELDWVCHRFGPNSLMAKKSMQKIDNAIRLIYNMLTDIFDNVNLLVFGDHGSVEVEKVVNIEKRLETISPKVGKDYVYFLGATMARFWFIRKYAKSILEKELRNLTCGKILEEDQLEKWGCKFDNSAFGELVWIANRGTIISPNFFNGPNIPKGMHGYLPTVEDNKSAFILSSQRINECSRFRDSLELVDIFPTILDLLRFPTPKSNQGTSILTRIRRRKQY